MTGKEKSDGAGVSLDEGDGPKYLDAIRTTVIDAGGVSAGLWISFIFVALYIMISSGELTYEDIFLENPVKMPFLNIELPLRGFFFLGPFILVAVHCYVLIHLSLLSQKVSAFNAELRYQVDRDKPNSANRTKIRQQLPINIFIQFLAGTRKVRDGAVGNSLRAIIWLTLVVAPVVVLLFMQLQMLSYQDAVLIWLQRIAILLDIFVLWAFWLGIVRPGKSSVKFGRYGFITAFYITEIVLTLYAIYYPYGDAARAVALLFAALGLAGAAWRRYTPSKFTQRSGGRTVKRSGSENCVVFLSVVSIFFSFCVANFPGEWLESKMSWLPGRKYLVDGEDDFISRKPVGLWSNHLVLLGANLAPKPGGLSLRSRRLVRANFTGANLPGLDFEGADLRGAAFNRAKLEGGRFNRASLQGAQFGDTILDGATFYKAHLQGASFQNTRFIGGSLSNADLAVTVFDGAQLQTTLLREAKLRGASMIGTQLQGASFESASFDITSLKGAFIWNTNMRDATARSRLQAADIDFSASGIGCDTKTRATGMTATDCNPDQAFSQLTSFVMSNNLNLVAKNTLIRKLSQLYDSSLNRIGVLDENKDWARHPLAMDAETFKAKLLQIYQEEACSKEGAPYVLEAVVQRLLPSEPVPSSGPRPQNPWMSQADTATLIARLLQADCRAAGSLRFETRQKMLEYASNHPPASGGQ